MLFFGTGVLLTNAYRVYLRVNEDEGVTTNKQGLLSHYEFRKAIALYWINDIEARTLYQCADNASLPSRAKAATSVSSMSADDFTIASSIDSSKRARKVNDASLLETGAYKCRLDRTLRHIAEKSKGRKKCPLHSWMGSEHAKQSDILYCPSCHINLCDECFSIFHNCPDLAGIKKSKQKQKRKR